MDASDRLEIAIRDYLSEMGLDNVYAWGEDRDNDKNPIEYVVLVTRLGVDGFPDHDLGLFDVRIATRGGTIHDNLVEAALGPEEQFNDRLESYAAEQGIQIYEASFNFPQEKITEGNRRERTFVFQLRARVNLRLGASSGGVLMVDGAEVHVGNRPIKISK